MIKLANDFREKCIKGLREKALCDTKTYVFIDFEHYTCAELADEIEQNTQFGFYFLCSALRHSKLDDIYSYALPVL
jgi:hypothetical protein